MKTKLVLIAVACLLLFAATGQTQQTEQTVATTQEDVAQVPMEDREQLHRQAYLKKLYRGFWDGQGADFMTLMVFIDPTIRNAFGISEEQNQQYEAHIQNNMNDPEFLKVMQEMDALWDSSEETQQRLRDLSELTASFLSNATADAVENTLTPEQKQMMMESRLANMVEMPIFLPSMLEALGLTDAQKQQMEEIKKEIEPEFEQHLDNWVNAEIALERMFIDRLKEEVEVIATPEGMRAIGKKMMAENPEFKRIYEEIQSKRQAFASKLKVQTFDVLTDEQWIRLQRLIDNPPTHALVFRKRMKELAGESEEDEKSDVWVPGPGSWRPGDAIPMQYRIERETRRGFPRGEN